MEKNQANSDLAIQSAIAFALSEYKCVEAIDATVKALGPVKTLPSFDKYETYGTAWRKAYIEESSCKVDSARKAFNRHFAACGYNGLPKMPDSAKSEATKTRAKLREDAKKKTAELIATFKTPEALRAEAGKAITSGNRATALQLSQAADQLGKAAQSTQEEERKDLRAKIVARVKACHNLETLRRIVEMLPAPVLNIAPAPAKATKGVKAAAPAKATKATKGTPVTA